MATQTLMLLADIEGSAAMVQRRVDAYAAMAAGDHRLIQAGLAGHGG